MVSAVHSNTNAQTSNNSSVNNSSKSWFSGFWFWNTSPPTEGEPSKFTAKELAEAIKNAFSKGQHSDLEELKINSSNINTQNNGKDKEDLTALHYAAGAGVYYSNNDRIEIIKFLIANNANVNIKSQNGWTPLHFACHKGLFEVAKLLLDAGADINAKENYGNTPLKTAFNYAFTIPSKVPELLIIAGADVNLKDNYNTSPLHEASTQKDLEIVKLLLTAGADINAKDKSGRTALLLASNRYNQKLNCEIKAKSEKRHGDIAVIENSYFNSAKMMNLLNDIENKLNNEGWTPFHFASCFDNKEFIKLYISKFDIDTITNDKVTPLHIAACNGHKELVEILIKANANIHSKTSDNWTPLHFAAHNGRIDIVKLLLINGASFDEEDNYKNTPIRLASQNNHTEIVKYLRNYISEIKENSELIHYPSYLVHTKILRLFIDYGANALHTSSKYGNLKAIQFIISQGADINEKDSFGWTPLHFATSGKMSGSFEDNSIKIVKLLLSNKAKVNAHEDLNGLTPLHQILRASYPGFSSKPFYNTHINAQIIKLLIEHKADIYSKDKDGNSCIDYLFKYYLHPWAYGESKDKYLFDKFIENLNTNQLRDIKKYILNKINLFSFEIEKQDLYISNLNICLLRIDKIITLIESKFAKTNEPRLKMIEDYFELPPEILTVNVKNFLEDESKKISLTELKECDKHSKKKKSLETKLLSEDFI